MKIAVIGDIHLKWDERDSLALDGADYDLALFVGDLSGYGVQGGIGVARAIAKLRTQALVLPGNHDAVTLPQLAAEVFRTPQLARGALSFGMRWRARQLEHALGRVPLCGYSLHHFPAHALSVLAARPHSMGGARLAYRRYLSRCFQVRDMRDSSDRLCALFDRVPEAHRVVVLAHCGPTGLGETREAIYGCDFRPEQGDWGDPDLARALTYAHAHGKRVIAVVAGHMHHALRGGGQRTWLLEQAGVLHVNAARVPRIRHSLLGEESHHVRLRVDGEQLTAEEVWLPLP